MNLRDRLNILRNRPRDPNAMPLSALAPMTKAERATAYADGKKKLDAAMAAHRREKTAA